MVLSISSIAYSLQVREAPRCGGRRITPLELDRSSAGETNQSQRMLTARCTRGQSPARVSQATARVARPHFGHAQDICVVGGLRHCPRDAEPAKPSSDDFHFTQVSQHVVPIGIVEIEADVTCLPSVLVYQLPDLPLVWFDTVVQVVLSCEIWIL